MKKIVSCLLFSVISALSAAVSMQVSNNSAILENEWLKAEFANPGGRLIALYDKQDKVNLTSNVKNDASSGACKDQIPTMDFSFRDSDYGFKQILNTPEKCTFKVTSMNSKLQWKFQQIEREYTLYANSKVLHCNLRIVNKQENMAPITIQYWMHNFFGAPNEENLFQFADHDGIKRFVPSDKSNNKLFVSPSRSWIGMIGKSGKGVIVIPEYKRLGMIYPWYCKGSGKFDTVEFRLIPESIPENSALETTILFAPAAHLPLISGAGAEASGFLTVEKSIAKGKFSAFTNCSGKIVLFADGKKLAEKNITLSVGKVTDFSFDTAKIPAKTAIVAVEFQRNGKKSFDLVYGKGNIPAEKRNASAINKEPWQYKFKDVANLPFFPWTKKDDPSVLALVPLNGVQDVFELKHRRPMQVEIPVLFPIDYAMSWRIGCTVPNVTDKSGCNQIINFMKGKTFNTYIVGSGVFYPWNKKYDVWSSIPQSTRSKILANIRNGAGLLIINPAKKSADIEKILAKGKDITAEIAAKMDFSAAPYFDKATIRENSYGKGRIIVLQYPSHGYLAPRCGARTGEQQKFHNNHRFQEYQFAILAKLTDRVNGRKDEITAFTAKGETAEITLNKASEITFTLFDSYTEKINSFTKKLAAGKNTVKLNGLLHGTNYIHAVSTSGDYAFCTAKVTKTPHVRRITVSRKNGVKAGLRIQGATPDTTAEYEIIDIDGRILHKGKGFNIKWDAANTVSNFHKIVVLIREKGVPTARFVREFNLPEKMTASSHFANLLWNSGDNMPEYIYPEYWKKFREFGFNFLYNGSTADANYARLLRYSPLESGVNWLAPFMFHSREGLDNWEKTHNKKYLARKYCPSNPNFFDKATVGTKCLNLIEDFCTRRIFQLGDEMSSTYYNAPFDNCICQYCLKNFREYLKKRHGSLAKLNAAWKTNFAKWDDVVPMTRIEILTHPVPAPWVEHRLFMDQLFMESMLQIKKNIQKSFPDAIVGPTGVNHPPHVYGGNWNFRNMSNLDCVSVYGPVRLTASFNRNKRLPMSYFGYSYNESYTHYHLWESLFQGARSTNNWYGYVFVLPNLELAKIRNFYKDLMWELRSGPGDLLYNSKKVSDSVGILHSQNSLISNFLKTRKTDYWMKENSFAQAMEDLGMDYRFVAPDELEKSNFKAIILPEASALSDREIAFLCKFVEKGGILIADYEAGTQTELCESRRNPEMNKLFGIKSRRFRLLSPEKNDIVSKLEISQVGSGVTLNGGKTEFFATARGRKVPIFIENKYGKGRTLLLNFSHNYTEQRSTASGKQLLSMLDKFLSLPKIACAKTDSHAVMHHFYQNGDNIYAALLPALPNGWRNMKVADFRKRKFNAELTFEREGFLYETISGKYIGHGKKFKIQMSPAMPQLYAMLPSKVKLDISAPAQLKQGGCAKININSSLKGHNVYILQVISPDGKEMFPFRQVAETQNGQAEFAIPFALNDTVGKWQICIKDGASGTKYTKSFELTEAK